MSKATRKPPVSFHQWEAVRKMVEKGCSFAEAGRTVGVSSQAVSMRAKGRGWKFTPRNGGTVGGASLQNASKTASPAKPGLVNKSYEQNSLGNAEKPAFQSLAAILEAANSDPMTFQSALAKHLQSLIAQGLRGIEPPKDLRELATLFGNWRKAAGLEDKSNGGNSSVLINVGGGLSVRGGRVVEAVEVGPEDLDSMLC